jgi:hypothetical protein
MLGRRPLDIHQFPDRRGSEPRKVRERNKQFFLAEQQPKTVSGDVGNLSHRSAWPRRYGTHLHVPQSRFVSTNLPITQTVVLCQFNGGFKPKLGLAVRTLYMHMHPRFFAREEVKPETVFPMNGRAHLANCSVEIPAPAFTASTTLLLTHPKAALLYIIKAYPLSSSKTYRSSTPAPTEGTSSPCGALRQRHSRSDCSTAFYEEIVRISELDFGGFIQSLHLGCIKPYAARSEVAK